MTWTYMELLTPTRHFAIVAKRWTVLGAICIIKQKNNHGIMHKDLFSIIPFCFDMDINEKVEKVLFTSIQCGRYAFAAQSTIVTLRNFFG